MSFSWSLIGIIVLQRCADQPVLHQPKPQLNTDAGMWQGYLLLVSELLVVDKMLRQSLIWTRQRDFSVASPIACNTSGHAWSPVSVCPSQICDICDGATHRHKASSSGEFHCWTRDGWTLDDVPQSCRLPAYAWWHRVTPVPNLCLVLKSLKADIHREVTSHAVHQSVSQFETLAPKTRGFFSLVASGLLKGTSVCSSKSPEPSQ